MSPARKVNARQADKPARAAKPATPEPEFRSGIVSLLGRPNVGKSTLVNSIVRSRVAITSPRPQTTRGRIFAIRTTPEHQIVFADTPGFHRATDVFGTAMVGVAKEESRGADVILYTVDVSEPPHQEDEDIVKFLGKHKLEAPVILVANKIDKVAPDVVNANLEQFKALYPFTSVFPVSAAIGSGLQQLENGIAEHLQPGPMLFPPDMITDQDPRIQAAEIVREKALMLTRQEVPHAIAVEIEEYREGKTPETWYMRGIIYVERESQKPIVVGKGGERLKKIGTLARQDLQASLGKKVFLELWVKVKEDWRQRRDVLRSWGFRV